MRILHARPSPALIIALLALFISLGGVSYGVATGSIDSREIKNSSIRGKDVKNNTLTRADVTRLTGGDVSDNSLTGDDVLESSLGQVPSASNADSANSATTATTATTANSVAPNGVNTAAIQNDAVTGAKIADDAVTGPKIAADAVGAGELKGTYAAVSGGTPAAANTFVDATATCNAGDTVLGGGFAWLSDADEIETVYSTPDPLTNPNTWIVRSRSGAANTLFAWAVCLAA